MIEFTPWPKTPRLFRDSIITEKIDGTNAAIGIKSVAYFDNGPLGAAKDRDVVAVSGGYAVYAQSRNRLINPESDNYGFAAWVAENAATLVADLGAGLHYGEWWGQGINRHYNMTSRVFSLFNTSKWADSEFETLNLSVVPVIDRCTFNTSYVMAAVDWLRRSGSMAAPGFTRPEGVCVYHTASNQVFKVLLENDDVPKSVALTAVPPQMMMAVAA